MKLVITIEAQDENNKVLTTKSGTITDINNINVGINQWVMETLISVKFEGLRIEGEPKKDIPDMVKEVLALFGPIELFTATNDGSEPLGRVLGFKEEGAIIRVLRQADGENGLPKIENGELVEEVVEVPRNLFIAVDSANVDITDKLLAFVKTLYKG